MTDVRRWTKFWWQDWQRDPALRVCSLAARGLWMELLCIAHEGTPVGHVTINGRAPSVRQIAMISGVSEKEAERLLGEMEDSGVFSRTETGVIFSRRMVRDHEASEAGRESVAKRWGKGEASGSPTHSPNTPPNREGIGGPNSLEAESEAERKTPPVRPPSPTADASPAAPAPARLQAERTGTRLPADWEPSTQLLEFAAGLGLDGESVAERFRDYWRAQPGARGRKSDWPATWRNWCRRESERPAPRASPRETDGFAVLARQFRAAEMRASAPPAADCDLLASPETTP